VGRQLVGVKRCRSVVVLASSSEPTQSDSEVVEKLLLLESFAGQRVPDSSTVAEVSQPQTAALVQATFTRTYAINTGAIAVQLSSKSLLMPGLCGFFSEVLSYNEGNEVYMRELQAAVGNSFDVLYDLLEGAVPMGVYNRADDRFEIVPSNDYVISPGDQVRLRACVGSFSHVQPCVYKETIP
jgi:hypothetical protein